MSHARLRSARLCAALALAFLVAPSTSHADNVVYSSAERDLAPEGSIFLDRNGDLYPGATVDIAPDDLRVEADNPYESLSLKDYYRRAFEAGSPAWAEVLADAGVTRAPEGFDAAWDAVQDGLRTNAVRRIDRMSDHGRRPAVLLVQGFNNTFLEAHDWYRLVRRDVLARVPGAAVVEVFWDGGSNPAAVPVWWVGQNNFRFAGLQLRRVIAGLAPDTPIRIVSHSSGGPAVANALGDASAPFRADYDAAVEHEERYFERVAAESGPHAPSRRGDLRVAMVVPAGAPNTFSRFTPRSTLPTRLIIGQNDRDFAVTKMGLGCQRGGNTCLAVRTDAFCDTRRHLRTLSPTMQVLGFDMSRSPNGTHGPKHGREDHAMTAYRKREDWTRLLDALLTDAPVADELSATCSAR